LLKKQSENEAEIDHLQIKDKRRALKSEKKPRQIFSLLNHEPK